MSEAVSIERRKIIRAYGGTVRLTPAAEGTDGAIRLARKLVAENPDKYFMPDQFANAANYLAHYENTALRSGSRRADRSTILSARSERREP